MIKSFRIGSRTVLAALVATTVTLPAPAFAIPDMGTGETTITIVLPDPDLATRLCTHTFTPKSQVNFLSTGLGTGTATEIGKASASTSGCTNSWTVTVTILDRVVAGSGGNIPKTGAASGSAPSLTLSQNVGYSTATREAGLVDFTLAATSAKASFCWHDIWEVSALGNPSVVSSEPC